MGQGSSKPAEAPAEVSQDVLEHDLAYTLFADSRFIFHTLALTFTGKTKAKTRNQDRKADLLLLSRHKEAAG